MGTGKHRWARNLNPSAHTAPGPGLDLGHGLDLGLVLDHGHVHDHDHVDVHEDEFVTVIETVIGTVNEIVNEDEIGRCQRF